MLLIPNTIGLIKNARHADAAQQLADFLRSPTVTDRLIAAKALEGPDPKSVTVPTLRVDWQKLLSDLEPTTAKLNSIFLR
jgi:ABC-type Fe3+ transport system substrate-binding protein